MGDHQWMVPMGDLARSNPLLQQLRLPRLGRAARGHVLLTKTLLIVGQEGSTQRGGPRAGVGDGAELRDPRPKTLRLRQGDWQGCWGGGAATQRDRSADDLHAERQAIHRRPDRGLQSICGTYRVVPCPDTGGLHHLGRWASTNNCPMPTRQK